MDIMVMPHFCWRRMFSVVGLLVFATALAGVAGYASKAVAMEQGDAASQAPPQSRSDYIVGPGDTLQVFVWRNPELSVTVPVRPDGRISTPLVEDMVAVGKTPAQLARDMEKVLGEFVRSPTVNVIVQNAASNLSQVKILGQVRTPQSVPFRDGIRILDVVLLSGGLTEFAAPNRAKLVRMQRDGKPRDIRVRLGDLLNKGAVDQNLELNPGDVLVVPQARF